MTARPIAECESSSGSSQSLDSTGEEMLSRALGRTFEAPPRERADLLERLTDEIAVTTGPGSGLRPWTCSVHTGTDGSRIFRGGLGYSIVVDPQGRLWRAGTVEDFETTYAITPTSCEIVAMKPKYAQMREYRRALLSTADGCTERPQRANRRPAVHLPPMPENLTLRIHYPLEDGDLLLRTDRDWELDVHPAAEAADRTWFDFPLELSQHYSYYKPIVRRGDEILWSKGENYLAVPYQRLVRDVYPHFFDDQTSSVDTLVHLPSRISTRTHALRVFTPPGYAENTLASYPVLYMQDGQNLFFPQEAFAGQTWMIEGTLHLLDAMNLVRRAITVGIYPQDRMADYTRPGYEDYGRYLVDEVKPWVDAHYRTLQDAPNTVVMGSSLGGVVSFYLAWQYPEVFGHAGCLSSTFGFRDDLMERVTAEPKRPIRLYLDSGWPGDNFEATYAMRNHLLERGYQEGSDLLYLAFPWAQHNEQNWAMRAHIPFQHFFRE